MSEYPLVSVIVPNYNHAQYLDQRLNSILNQTYRNIEVIILDDYSTDNSFDVISKYTSDPRVIKVIANEKNSGNTFLQWDIGLHEASGDIIWIAESDDYCDVNMLAELVRLYNSKKDIVIAYSTTWYVDDNGNKWEGSKEGRSKVVSGDSFVKKYLTLGNTIQNASCAIFKKTSALGIDKKYQQYRGIGDYWFWLLIAETGSVAILNRHYNYFRRHSGVVTDRLVFDGTSLFDERVLIDYIIDKYHIGNLRKAYIAQFHADSKRWLPFCSQEVRSKVSDVWEFNKTYPFIYRFSYKFFSYCRRHFLLYV